MSLIVFDLDGTLVDSRRDLAESANAVLEWAGAQPLDEDAVGRMVGEGAAVLVARVFTAAGIEQPPDALARFLSFYSSRVLRFTRPYAGIVEALEHLRGRAQLAVLTNKPLAATRQILDGLDLARFFSPSLVRGGDGPLARKPDPAGLMALMSEARAGVADTWMVGDSAIDWRTGRNGGVRVCLVRWGFGFHSVDPDELDPLNVVIASPAELPTLL